MKKDHLYVEHLTQELNSYELKMFRVQHDETQLTAYLKKFAKKHEASNDNKIYLVRSVATGQLVAWFATLSRSGCRNNPREFNKKICVFPIPMLQ